MIESDQKLEVTLAPIEKFRRQVADLRRLETNPTNYRLSVDGHLGAIDRINLEVRDYRRRRATE